MKAQNEKNFFMKSFCSYGFTRKSVLALYDAIQEWENNEQDTYSLDDIHGYIREWLALNPPEALACKITLRRALADSINIDPEQITLWRKNAGKNT
jgi:hypothetical protein